MFCGDKSKNLNQIVFSIKIEPKKNKIKYKTGVVIKIQTRG